MQKIKIRYIGESGQRLLVFYTYGLVCPVPAGHYQHFQIPGQKQMMQRCIGEHYAQVGHVGGDLFTWILLRIFSCQYNWSFQGLQHLFLPGANLCQSFRSLQGIHHNCKWLDLPVLALPQILNSFLIGGIGAEMESAQSFDSPNISLFQKPNGILHRIIARHFPAISIHKLQLWTAIRAGIRLCMETPVCGIEVFPFTAWAQGELGHGSIFAVIGQGTDYGQPRAAIGAIDKRIQIAAVPGIEKLLQAIFTGGSIRGNIGSNLTLLITLQYIKPGCTHDIHFLLLNSGNGGQGGKFILQGMFKVLDIRCRPFDLGNHTLGGILDKTVQSVFSSQPVNKGPKSHTLYKTLKLDALPVYIVQALKRLYIFRFIHIT